MKLLFYSKWAGVVGEHTDQRQAKWMVLWIPGSNPGSDFIGNKVLRTLVIQAGSWLIHGEVLCRTGYEFAVIDRPLTVPYISTALHSQCYLAPIPYFRFIVIALFNQRHNPKSGGAL